MFLLVFCIVAIVAAFATVVTVLILRNRGPLTFESFVGNNLIVQRGATTIRTSSPRFIFVNNTSTSSEGTYEHPYSTLAAAEACSSVADVIMIFPGDGTSLGMDVGIALKNNQEIFGTGVSHTIQSSEGSVTIPALSNSSPTITNTDIDTEGYAIALATENTISGINITNPLSDAIYGVDLHALEVSFCTFVGAAVYAIEASFSGVDDDGYMSIRNNQFLNNVNGVFMTFSSGTSTANITCLDNTFSGQTSVSSVPLEMACLSNNTITAHIEDNTFEDNTTGGVRFSLENVINTVVLAIHNTFTNNDTGSASSLGSAFVVLSTGTNENGTFTLDGNTFSENGSHALYMHTGGAFANLQTTASENTMSGNGGGGLIFATPVDETFTLIATENAITGGNDTGISVIGSTNTTTGNITIDSNTIANIEGMSNGIAINQAFSVLTLTISDNEIDGCEGTGILSYASDPGTDSLTLTISGNTISNCENLSSNAAGGIDIEQYNVIVEGSIANNTLTNNTGTSVYIGSALTAPEVCLEMSGNNSDVGYVLASGTGVFNLAPCNVDDVNVGTITAVGTITHVQSCPGGLPCPS
jgi:hypothetical protein